MPFYSFFYLYSRIPSLDRLGIRNYRLKTSQIHVLFLATELVSMQCDELIVRVSSGTLTHPLRSDYLHFKDFIPVKKES